MKRKGHVHIQQRLLSTAWTRCAPATLRLTVLVQMLKKKNIFIDSVDSFWCGIEGSTNTKEKQHVHIQAKTFVNCLGWICTQTQGRQPLYRCSKKKTYSSIPSIYNFDLLFEGSTNTKKKRQATYRFLDSRNIPSLAVCCNCGLCIVTHGLLGAWYGGAS